MTYLQALESTYSLLEGAEMKDGNHKHYVNGICNIIVVDTKDQLDFIVFNVKDSEVITSFDFTLKVEGHYRSTFTKSFILMSLGDAINKYKEFRKPEYPNLFVNLKKRLNSK
jgi:hypothetical protein